MTRRLHITTRPTGTELERVLRILFAHGFVFNNERRIKTFEDFVKIYDSDSRNVFAEWNYITLGRNQTCKMVLDAWMNSPHESEAISLDEFLKELHDW